MFTWIPLHRAAAIHILQFENKPDQLIATLRAMQNAGLKTIGLRDFDKTTSGEEIEIELAEIDPFTFFATFHRTGEAMRARLWKWLREDWNLSGEIPSDFNGIPTIDARNSWFFPYAGWRDQGDVPALWALARSAIENGINGLSDENLSRCLKIAGVGWSKLSSGLFWLNPQAFLPLNDLMQEYFLSHGLDFDIKAMESGDASAYKNLLNAVHEKLGYEHAKISHAAWQWKNGQSTPRRYWAGGHDWSTGSQLERFLKNAEWQLGYTEEQDRPVARRTRELFEQISVGDLLAIKGCNYTTLKVHLLGEVTEINAETQTVKLAPKTDSRAVPFSLPRPLGKGAGAWLESLLEVKREEDIAQIFGEVPIPPSISPDEDEDESTLPQDEIIEDDEPTFPLGEDEPLNRILYGPPGTGKTFSTIEEAVRIVRGHLNNENGEPLSRAQIRALWDKWRDSGRIAFVTFHQSFSYEEFIEGIRPASEPSTQAVTFAPRDGIFKILAADATKAMDKGRRSATFNQLHSELLRRIKSEPDRVYEIAESSSKWKLSVNSHDTIEAADIHSDGGASLRCSKDMVERTFTEHRDKDTISSREVYETSGTGHTNLTALVFQLLKKVEAQFAPQPPRFVLVIDEINRGNIARILGELITLLEDDKRLGRENELRATLPYSNDSFGLPPNLFIIGTMNTADKSLALLDIALRRRFEFQEIRPNFGVCENLDDAMRKVLEELNARLMATLDREHRIGHAYWMKVQSTDDWNRVFEKRIVPLLSEYFHNDWDGLRAALGESGDGKIIKKLAPRSGTRARTLWAWWHDVDENQPAPNFLEVLGANYFGAQKLESGVIDESLDGEEIAEEEN